MAARAPTSTERQAAIKWLTALVLLGAWSTLPPYLGPPLGLKLDTASRLEVADHVIPGTIVVVGAAVALMALRQGRQMTESLLVFGAIGVCVLAGVWETVTHIPLIFQGGDADAPWGSVLFHSTPGFVVLGVSLTLLIRALGPELRDRPQREPEPPTPRPRPGRTRR